MLTFMQTEPRFPVEIWSHIFSLATAIRGKDEFSLEEDAFGMMPYGPDGRSILFTRKELSSILKMRYTIVRVCKWWYNLGIRSLWSHLRMRVAAWETQSLNIQRIINSKPEYIRYILRLTVEEQILRTFEDYVRKPPLAGVNIISNFTNVKIIVYPLGDIMNYLPPRVEVVYISRPTNRVAHKLHLRSIQTSLRSLSLMMGTFDSITLGDQALNKVSFPALTTLKVDTSREVAKHITEHWVLPVLTTLSIRSAWGAWIPFLHKYCLSIKRLDMDRWEELDDEVPIGLQFDMPLLSSLAFEFDNQLTLPWIKYIKSNSLQHVSICDIDFIETFESKPEMVMEVAKTVIASYPGIKSLCLYERGRALSPQTRYGLGQQDISTLENRGVTIKIHEDARSDVLEEIRREILPLWSPLDLLTSLLFRHRNLKQIMEQFQTSIVDIQSSGTLRKQVTYSIGIYRVTGEPAVTIIDAQNSAAGRLLEIIREDIY